MTITVKRGIATSRVARCLAALLGVVALASSIDRADAQTPFYRASADELAGPPGTLIRSVPSRCRLRRQGRRPIGCSIARRDCRANRSRCPA